MIFGKKLPVRIISMVLGLIVCYAFGTAWFIIVYTHNTGAVDLATALGWCVIPFIIPDLLKLTLAVFVSSRLAAAIPLTSQSSSS
jgi:biotin transport system substrate-specific component